MEHSDRTATLDFAAALSSIGLDELNAAAALQTRIDRKYLVPERVAQRVLAELDATAQVLTIGGRHTFAYNSVYFDTPDHVSFLAAATGRRRRFKVRTRSYLDTGSTFLEVKTEGSRDATVKERIAYRPADRSHLTREGIDYVAETLAVALGDACTVDPRNMRPVIETDYDRTTVYLPASESRATVDERLVWRMPGGRAARMAGAVVIETKSGSSPGALDRSLWAAGIRPSRFSKFATGLAALEPTLRSNKWHRTLARDLAIVPAP